MAHRARRTLRSRFAWRAALTTTIVVAAIGVASIAYWEAQVKAAIEDGVADHLRALEAEVDLAALSLSDLSDPVVLPTPERFVQVVTPSGRVVAASSELASLGPVLSAADVAAASYDVVVEIEDPSGAGRALVMARPMSVDGEQLVGIVGASLEPEAAARSTSLWIVGLAVPLLAALIGWGVWLAVTYAMRPVNQLASRADAVANGAAPWRLEVEPDTVELSALAQSLDKLLDHLRETFESERQFLDDASHELRTPIAVARGELDLLRHEVGDDAAAAAAVTSSIEEMDRLDRLASDLLTLARARDAHPRAGHCDLAALARRATATIMREPNQRSVKVSVRGSASAMGDEEALERVFRNTIQNAVSHCAQEVKVMLTMEDGQATATISDDGPGFPEGLTGSSFPRFARARTRNRDGTGLGLAITSAIVEAHGGTISANNTGEPGACVTVRLPATVPG